MGTLLTQVRGNTEEARTEEVWVWRGAGIGQSKAAGRAELA